MLPCEERSISVLFCPTLCPTQKRMGSKKLTLLKKKCLTDCQLPQFSYFCNRITDDKTVSTFERSQSAFFQRSLHQTAHSSASPCDV